MPKSSTAWGKQSVPLFSFSILLSSMKSFNYPKVSAVIQINVSWASSLRNESSDSFHAFLYIERFSDIQMNGFCKEAYEIYQKNIGFSLVTSLWHWTGHPYAHVLNGEEGLTRSFCRSPKSWERLRPLNRKHVMQFPTIDLVNVFTRIIQNFWRVWTTVAFTSEVNARRWLLCTINFEKLFL